MIGRLWPLGLLATMRTLFLAHIAAFFFMGLSNAHGIKALGPWEIREFGPWEIQIALGLALVFAALARCVIMRAEARAAVGGGSR